MIPACPIIGTRAPEPQEIGGQAGGHGGQQDASQRPRKRAAELERTTGFEPATLTLAKGDAFRPWRPLSPVEQAPLRRLVRPVRQSSLLSGATLFNTLNNLRNLREGPLPQLPPHPHAHLDGVARRAQEPGKDDVVNRDADMSAQAINAGDRTHDETELPVTAAELVTEDRAPLLTDDNRLASAPPYRYHPCRGRADVSAWQEGSRCTSAPRRSPL